MTATTAILGAGAWGTAMAVMLARSGHRVVLCVRRRDLLEAIESAHENAAYLPGVAIPGTVELAIDWADAASSAETIVMAVPSRFARGAMEEIADAISDRATIVSATKGIEENSLKTMTAMLAEAAPKAPAYATLSGPG